MTHPKIDTEDSKNILFCFNYCNRDAKPSLYIKEKSENKNSSTDDKINQSNNDDGFNKEIFEIQKKNERKKIYTKFFGNSSESIDNSLKISNSNNLEQKKSVKNMEITNYILAIKKIIKIQATIKGFLYRKFFFIIHNDIHIGINKINDKNDIKNEEALCLGLSMKGNFSDKNMSSLNNDDVLNYIKENELRNIGNYIFPFVLKSKKGIKYKFNGRLKDHIISNNNNITTSCASPQMKIKQFNPKYKTINSDNIKTVYTINNKLLNKTLNIQPDQLSSSLGNAIKTGYGKLLFEDETFFESNFDNNKACGISKYKNKKEIFIGNYNFNELKGYGIYKNLSLDYEVEGYFEINELKGVGFEKNNKYGFTYRGEFENNVKQGIGRVVWKEGVIFEGKFKKNQMVFGTIIYPDEKVYQGELKNGKMDGYGEFFWPDNRKYFGEYENDMRNGFGIFIWENSEEEIIAVNQRLQSSKKNVGLLKVKSNNIINKSFCSEKNVSCYLGFWKNGQMHGMGAKINSDCVKIGIWNNGKKIKWIKSILEFNKYSVNLDSKYIHIFRGSTESIFKFINIFYKTSPKENTIISDDSERE